MIGNGSTYNDNCNNITREHYAHKIEGKCKFNEEFWSTKKPSIQECDNNVKERFQIEKYWDCNGKILDGKNTLCIPPRRNEMCLKQLERMDSADVTNNTKLLKKIEEIAKNEGDDILKNLLPKYPCNEDVICKSMKYSFADLGDIVRGTDKYKDVIGSISSGNNSEQIEENLKTIFENIQKNR